MLKNKPISNGPNILKGITIKNSNLSSSILKNISNLLFSKKIKIYFSIYYYFYLIVKLYSILFIKKSTLFLFTLIYKIQEKCIIDGDKYLSLYLKYHETNVDQ
jgi:hypothetical protein